MLCNSFNPCLPCLAPISHNLQGQLKQNKNKGYITLILLNFSNIASVLLTVCPEQS